MGQIISGIFLALYYNSDSMGAFNSVQYIIFEVDKGWFIRVYHFNSVRFFFFVVYLHLLKGLFFFSYRLKEVWVLGIIILLFLIITAFMGYVLVWAQISFWAGVVITSLVSVIPYLGSKLIWFVWGSFLFRGNSLKFFFVLHFVLPFFILILVFFHLYYLHFYGRTSKLFLHLDLFKVTFYPFY